MTHTLIYPHTTVHNAAGHLEIGGCDVVELARDVRHAAVHLRRADAARPVPRLPRGVRRAHRPLRDRLREQGVQLPGDVRAGRRRRASRSTSPPAASWPRPALAGFPPARIYFHGNNKSVAEIEAGLDAGIGHFVVDSFEEIDRLEAAARRRGVRAAGARARHAGRAAQHARLRADRPAGQQVRVRAGRRPRRTRRCAACGERRRPRARRRARPHRLADLRARLVPARGRGAVRRRRRLAPGLRLRVPRLQHRRRPRHPLHAAGPCRAPSPSSPRSPWRGRRGRPQPGTACRMPEPLRRAGAQHRRQGGGHRLHASAPSRRSPACAPTWPSTAA